MRLSCYGLIPRIGPIHMKTLSKTAKSAIIVGMSTHKFFLRRAWLPLLCIGAFLAAVQPELAAAAAPGPAAFPVGPEYDIANVVSMIISVLNIFTWIVFLFLKIAIDPNFIFNLDSGGQFLDILNNIWQLSRDLMNLVFAFALVGAAIYTIVTTDKEFVSSHVKKFVLAVILVNFSWFFPQVILDVANVTASTVFSLPSLLPNQAKSCEYLTTVNEGTALCTEETPAKPDPDTGTQRPAMYKCKCSSVVNAEMFLSADEAKTLDGKGWQCFGPTLCVQREVLDLSKSAGFSAILDGLVVNQARLGDLGKVPAPINAGNVGQLVMFLLREALILVIHIALFFPLLALMIAFFIRIPVLWITMAFMPFMFLSFVAGDRGGEFMEYPKKLFGQFLKAAFLPALVGIPLSIGFILINAGQSLPSPLRDGQIRLFDSISTYWQLLWLFMTLGVIWIGVFAVLEKAGIMGKGSQAIKSFGQTLGKIAVKAPLALPIIPGFGGGKMTPFGAVQTLKGVESELSRGKSLKATLDSIKSGAAAGHGRNLAAAEKLASDKPGLDQLHKDLENLRTVLADPKSSNVDRQKALEPIKHRGIELDLNNIHTSLTGFIEDLKTKGAAKNAADALNRIEQTAAQIKATATPAAP